MNGLYLQLHAYMLRIAIPYGTLSSPADAPLADIARRYDKGYGHFTTRQNIQYNWIKLEDAPDILAEAGRGRDARHPDQRQLHPQRHVRPVRRRRRRRDRGSAPWAEMIRQWSTSTRNSPSCRASSRSR
jgi:sulfite reductase (NADPH) hemoprotein beta-component